MKIFKKLLPLLILAPALFLGLTAANRVKTWTSGEILTASDLNAEVNNIYIGEVVRTAGYWGANDNIPVLLGSSLDAQLEWNTAQGQDAVVLGVSGSRTVIFTEFTDIDTNYGIASQTDPLFVVHSSDATTVADYVSLQHNQTDGVVNSAAGGLSLRALGVEGIRVNSATNIAVQIGHTFTGTTGTSIYGLLVNSALTTKSGDATAYQMGITSGTITTSGNTDVYTHIASLQVNEPDITLGAGDTVTTASSLRIVGPPDEGVTNWAFLIDSGNAKFDEGIEVDGSTQLDGATVVAGAFSTESTATIEPTSDVVALTIQGHTSDSAIQFLIERYDNSEIFSVGYSNGIKMHKRLGTNTLEMYNGAILTHYFNADVNDSTFAMPSHALVDDAAGPTIQIGSNTNASNSNPGTVALSDGDDVQWFIWVDTTGDLRIGSAAPADATTDTSGTVVGTQS